MIFDTGIAPNRLLAAEIGSVLGPSLDADALLLSRQQASHHLFEAYLVL